MRRILFAAVLLGCLAPATAQASSLDRAETAAARYANADVAICRAYRTTAWKCYAYADFETVAAVRVVKNGSRYRVSSWYR